MAADDELSRVFAALADPTRRAMLEQLGHGTATVGDLAAPHAMSRPAISQHLRVLEHAGLIERTVRAQWRLCSLRPEGLDEATAWVERNRAVWEERFDRLDDRLAAMRGERDAGDTDKERAP